MPYVIKECLKTAGKHMYLLQIPLMDDSAGVWTEHREDAEKFRTLKEANTALGKLNVLNAGTPEYYASQMQMEDNVAGSDWVIKSNITNEYIVQAQIYREPEIWSHKLSKALHFDTAGAAQDFANSYLLGKKIADTDTGQTFDIDYITVPKKREKDGKSALLQNVNTVENDYHFVIVCNATLTYLKKFFWAQRTVEWVADIREAKQFRFYAAARASAKRVNSVSVVTSIYTVYSKTYKIVQSKLRQNSEEKMPEKRNFRIQRKHGIGYQIDATYVSTTEMEALNRMFEEAKKMSNKPFTAGSIKAYEEVAGKSM